MTDPGRARPSRPTRGRRETRQQRPWQLAVAVLTLLAVVASLVAVFSDSVQILRIGVVIALWAAVLAAIAMTRYRKDSEADAAKTRDMQLVYELQLEREIAARREYELVVETQVRRQVEAQVRNETTEELVGLRRELEALRASLEVVFDGDLPDERMAVRAEARRLQELGGGPGGLLAAQAADLPPLDEVTAAGEDETGFQPDYEGYRAAAQEVLPGLEFAAEPGDDAGDGADDDHDEAEYDDYVEHEDAYVDVVAEETVVSDWSAPIDDEPVAESEAETEDEADRGGETQPTGPWTGSAIDQTAVDAFDAFVDLPGRSAEPVGEADEVDEHGTRRADDGGSTVAELMARMQASGSLPAGRALGRRHRRAAD